ncbi:uncharacterized protein [Mytilus edulis]|uniref:uncharacterized protein n=1 Tax=Mytilus edulis TaxID=6550 RepID=UPI0039EF9BEC
MTNSSIALYRYMCQNIVGSEEHVKTIRMMNTARDNLQSFKAGTLITSGSNGEGLQMRSSDIDIMIVMKQIVVYEETNIYFKSDKIHFTMEQEDTQSGFTKLRLVHSNDLGIFTVCNTIGSDFYFSNFSFKQQSLSNDDHSTVHGPCVNDEDGLHDFAKCVHCKCWISPAKQWVTRSNNSWPSNDLKQAVVKHGVLFVPVGVKGSTQEEIEWRISLSIDLVIKHASIALYHYLCHNIVGLEEHVNTLRLMNNVRDNLQSNNMWTLITSGSFGEGLQMLGSDLDIMAVLNLINICEDTPIYFNAGKVYFTMEMEDTQPGFTKLRLVHGFVPSMLSYCDEIDRGFYFSNFSYKQKSYSKIFSTIHGPCVSDENQICDLAYCLHSKLWITPAKQWITRSNNSWPRYDLKQDIVKHGVLFVPVGVKGSSQEELEWRISFSVGEKLLIYSFTHTQLLCYSLLKILIKDVIALDIDCKELLCSYFMKTILFWICEELPSSVWTSENLISCYMRCFRRLMYCVEYSFCPHYFIPENNLFENKIHGKAQKLLLNRLYILNSHGWQCIFLSDQISSFNALTSYRSIETSYLYANSVERLLNSFVFNADYWCSTFYFPLEKCICKVLSSKSSKIQYLFTYFLSMFCCRSDRFLSFEDMPCNKSTYKQYNTYISTLFLNTRHDAVSGWLKLASFFYKKKQYSTALHIIQYSLLKCTPEKLHHFMQFSNIHYELFDLHLFRNMHIVQLWKFLLLASMRIDNSSLYPDELHMEKKQIIPPVVYAQFLRFMCHYHLKNTRQCCDSLRDLQLSIRENISIDIFKGLSYNILGICFKMLGDKEAARQSFMHSIELFPDQNLNGAFQQLSFFS